MHNKDETLSGLMKDHQRLLKASFNKMHLVKILRISIHIKQKILLRMNMQLEILELQREDPDSVLFMNGLEMSIEEKLTEKMEETEEKLSKCRASFSELKEDSEKKLEALEALGCLIKALKEMANGADVAVGVKMIGGIDFIALQDTCETKFMEDLRLQELIKARVFGDSVIMTC